MLVIVRNGVEGVTTVKKKREEKIQNWGQILAFARANCGTANLFIFVSILINFQRMMK
jgi:hypothetical protein